MDRWDCINCIDGWMDGWDWDGLDCMVREFGVCLFLELCLVLERFLWYGVVFFAISSFCVFFLVPLSAVIPRAALILCPFVCLL